MSKHPESISLHSLSLTPSSKWSLDTDELEQATKSHAPKPPPHTWLHSIHHKAPTHHSYLIGDPILLPNSSTVYTFEGWEGPSTTNVAGERMRQANFQWHPALLPPYEGISINLYCRQEDVQAQTCPRPPLWKRLWKDVIGWIRRVCMNWNWSCMSRHHALRGGWCQNSRLYFLFLCSFWLCNKRRLRV